LRRQGIERLEAKKNGETIESIEREDVPMTGLPAVIGNRALVPLAEAEHIAPFEIVRLSFEDRYKWTFTDGNLTFNADVDDEVFWNRLQRRELSFSKGDILRVRYTVRSWRDEKGLHSEYKIIEVIEVLPAASQPKLL
jgi:hypothetical protein